VQRHAVPPAVQSAAKEGSLHCHSAKRGSW
jgi:hypothetical protein